VVFGGSVFDEVLRERVDVGVSKRGQPVASSARALSERRVGRCGFESSAFGHVASIVSAASCRTCSCDSALSARIGRLGTPVYSPPKGLKDEGSLGVNNTASTAHTQEAVDHITLRSLIDYSNHLYTAIILLQSLRHAAESNR